MREVTNFFGQKDGVPEELYKMVAGAPKISAFPISSEGSTRGEPIEGTIDIRQRGGACLTRNRHEPRPYIVCWNNGVGYSDISFHSTVGGEHGALHAQRQMFERYVKE